MTYSYMIAVMIFIVLHTINYFAIQKVIVNYKQAYGLLLQGIYSFNDLHKSFPVKEQLCL